MGFEPRIFRSRGERLNHKANEAEILLMGQVLSSELLYLGTSLPGATTFVGQVVKASTSRAADPSSIPAFPVGIFRGRVIPVT